MARAIWSGSISFGMVSIPVKLYGATESKDISFHLLHATCGTRLKQVRWCPTDEVEVPWSETVRGYEYAKGEYVTLTDEDFEQLPLPSKHTIELSAFVEESEIDPVFYERSYYLEPDERAREALRAPAQGAGEEGPHRASPPSRSGRRSSSAPSAPARAPSCWRRSTTPTRCRGARRGPRRAQGDRARARHGLHPDRAAAEAVRARGVSRSLSRGAGAADRGQARGQAGGPSPAPRRPR